MATTLKAKGKLRGKTPRTVKKAPLAAKPEPDSERPIWETVAELGAQIADADWTQVPDDSSLNYKRHLYGSPTERA